MRWLYPLIVAFYAFSAQAADTISLPSQPHGLARIGHIIVISLENHSFDNLFGTFPGAVGLESAKNAAKQTDRDGKIYSFLPPVMNHSKLKARRDTRFPEQLRNEPFLIEKYVAQNQRTVDLVHRFYQHQQQINGGTMNRFAAVSDAGALTMGYYDGSKTTLWAYAKRYTLADHFFAGAFGGSFLNHMWLVCACAPRFEKAPKSIVAKLDSNGQLLKDGAVTPDGYAVNTVFSSVGPHPASDPAQLLPAQTLPTIGDRLSEHKISWAWYSGGWNRAIAGKTDDSFQFHHQPFAYFASFAEGTTARAQHLKDESDFLAALKDGSLPQVAFYKPLGEYSLHPGYTDIRSGDAHIGEILRAIEASPVWKDSVVIVTFDEHGGFWDHLAPPKGDRFGPGERVPTLIISPFARTAYVDHHVYETSSILKLIEDRFGLTPLGERDAKAGDLRGALVLQ